MIHGMYVIDKVTHTHTELFSDGAARKIEFSLSLKRVDDSLAAIYGDLKTQADNLVSLTMTDNRGFEADQLDIELDDTDGLVELPPRGAKLTLWLGWQGSALLNKGSFTVDEIEHRGAPDTLTIRGRSADFRGTLNSRREQSWHDTTLGVIVETIAARNKLTASVADTLKATIERGDGDRHQFAIADREAYTGVTAKWLHTKDPKPQKQKVKLRRKPKAQHLRALQHPKATKTTSKARAKKKQEAREGEYMVGESENVLELTTIYATKAQLRRSGTKFSAESRSFQSRWLLVGQIYFLKRQSR